MRQIIPFKKELLFKTKVSEITSISLEHTLALDKESKISGQFYITGDYKMTQASINREKFQFTLPFEISMDTSYKVDTINIDIDNFYYEVVNDDTLQVNIDVYVDGEKKEEEEIIKKEEEESIEPVRNTEENIEEELERIEDTEDINDELLTEKDIKEIVIDTIEIEDEGRVDEKKEEIKSKEKVEQIQENTKVETKQKNYQKTKEEDKLETTKEYQKIVSDIEQNSNNIRPTISNNDQIDANTNDDIELNINNINNNNNENTNINNNILNNEQLDGDTYVTYYVYLVKEEDTIDKIMEKFEVTKENIEDYNDITNMKPGMKLIIPSVNE